jgi:hypothetical protein
MPLVSRDITGQRATFRRGVITASAPHSEPITPENEKCRVATWFGSAKAGVGFH